MTETTIWGLVGSITGALAVFLVQEILDYLRSIPNALTGEWEEHIAGTEGYPNRVDRVLLRCVGSKVSGTIERKLPKEDNYKRWRLQGRIRGEFLFAIFWCADVHRAPKSYGTIQMLIKDENYLAGTYIRPRSVADCESVMSALSQRKLEWRRIG